MSLVSIFLFLGLRGFFSSYSLSRSLNFVDNSLVLSGFIGHRRRYVSVNKLIGIRDDNFEIARRSLIFDEGYIYICVEFANSTLCKATAYR